MHKVGKASPLVAVGESRGHGVGAHVAVVDVRLLPTWLGLLVMQCVFGGLLRISTQNLIFLLFKDISLFAGLLKQTY